MRNGRASGAGGAPPRAPRAPAQRYAAIPLEGWGPDTRPRPTVIRGAGPDHPWDAETGEWLQAAPGPQTGWTGDVSSLVRTPSPPPHRPSVHQRTPGYGDTQMGTRPGHRRVAPPRGRGRPARRGALQSWGAGIRRRPVPAGQHPGALAPHAPHRHCSRAVPGAGQLRRAASGMGGSRGRHPTGPPPPGRPERVPIGCADAPPHGVPRVHGNPPQGHPRPAWGYLIAAFHDHGILPDDTWREVQRKTLGRDYRRPVRLACWRSGTPSGRGGTTSGPAISTLGRRPPTSHTPAGSAGNVTRCPPQRRQGPTGARGAPRWPRAPGPNLPQARAGAQRRGPCTGASRGHTPPNTNARAPRALPFCGSTCTCGTPHPLRTCRTCSRPDPHPLPPFAEPAVPCHADGGMGRDTPGPAAKRRRRPSGAWWRTRWQRRTRRTLPHGVT